MDLSAYDKYVELVGKIRGTLDVLPDEKAAQYIRKLIEEFDRKRDAR